MAIIPVIILGSIAVYNAKSSIEKETDQQILMISKSIADMVDGVMTSESNAIAMLAQRDAVIQAAKEANAGGSAQKVDFLQKELAKLQSITKGRYDFIIISGKDGVVFTDSVNGATKGLKAGDRDYFKKAMQGQANMDSVVLNKKNNEPVCSIAHPVKDENGQVIGMIAGLMKVSFLAAKINEIKLGKTGYAYMINKEGVGDCLPGCQTSPPTQSFQGTGYGGCHGESPCRRDRVSRNILTKGSINTPVLPPSRSTAGVL